MSRTLRYYDINAARFVADTVHVDMADLHARFLAHIPAGGLILDAGCGSGRDSKAFIDAGLRVRAFDASARATSVSVIAPTPECSTRTRTSSLPIFSIA